MILSLLIGACRATPVPLIEPTATAGPTSLPQRTPAPTQTQTLTTVPSATLTQTPTTVPSPTPEPTPVPTRTPEPTATVPPTATATPPPPPTDTPPPTEAPAPTSTSTFTPSPEPVTCPAPPAGSFLAIWQSTGQLQQALGCPVSHHPRITPTAWEVATAYQPFEHGAMIWSDHIGWYAQPVVYVLHPGGAFQRVADTFDPATDPIGGGERPPPALLEPRYGFGKVWREAPGVRASLGWATADETAGQGRFQTFAGGDMVWISQTGRTYVFSGGTVQTFDIPFAAP